MVNKRFWLGILVMALVFGMTAVGCSDGSTDLGSLDGVWENNAEFYIYRITFSGSDWLEEYEYEKGVYDNLAKGTYKVEGKKITFTVTHRTEGGDWVSYPYYYIGVLSDDGKSFVAGGETYNKK